LRACLSAALIRSRWGYAFFPMRRYWERASPRMGPGQGFKEDKQRTRCAEKIGYTSLPQKSRQTVLG